MGSKSLMFGVKLPATFHLCFIACGPAVFDATTDICVDVDVVAKVMREGLIDLLVVVATLTYPGAWQAGGRRGVN